MNTPSYYLVSDLINQHVEGSPPVIIEPRVPIDEMTNPRKLIYRTTSFIHNQIRIDVIKYIPRTLLTTFVRFKYYNEISSRYESTIFGEPLTDMLYAQIHSNIMNYLFMDLVNDSTIFNFVSISARQHRNYEPVHIELSKQLYKKIINDE